jgi:DNA-binding GntR family transcriptional regulator
MNLGVERPIPVREQVASQIREAIADLRLTPGQPLVERELCEATGTSRTSVREALRQLESEGLVVSVPGRGITVARVTRTEAADLYEVRAALEGEAGRLFATRATGTDLQLLAQAVAAIERVSADPRQMLQAKSEFYRTLFAGTKNQQLSQLLEMLHRRVTLLRSLSLSMPGRPAESTREMRAILEAATRRDADETRRLCIAHVEAAARAGLAGLEAPHETSAPMQ